MNERDLAEEIMELLSEDYRTATFDQAGVLTTNEGLVVKLEDGTEFQITVVRSK